MVRYTGKQDETSIRNLRRFIEKLDPVIAPLVLHGDDDMDCDAAICYYPKSREDSRRAQTSLKNFCNFCFERSKGNSLVVWGRYTFYHTKYSLIDLELNSGMGLKKAVKLIKNLYNVINNIKSEKNLYLIIFRFYFIPYRFLAIKSC